MKIKKIIIPAVAVAVVLLVVIVVCLGAPNQDASKLRVGSLKGPTTVGMSQLMNSDAYVCSLYTAGDELVQKMLTKDIDIALMPSNTAANLYAKTDGDITVLNINTLCPLYIATRDHSITSFYDLNNKTVYMTGKSTAPEYVMRYLMDAFGVTVQLEFKSEPTEVASLLAAQSDAVALLPEPFASATTLKDPSIKLAFNLEQSWQSASPSNSHIVTGVTVVRNDVLRQRPYEIEQFLADEQASVAKALEDSQSVVEIMVDRNVFPSVQVAERAIPQCSVAFITGGPMASMLGTYLNVLYQQDPKTVGGALPKDSFYYPYQAIELTNAYD